jgi:Family of unknown function (DUF6519)
VANTESKIVLTLDTDVPASILSGDAKARRIVSALTQPYYPAVPLPKGQDPIICLVYLDVWERHVSASQADGIKEAALGGPDSTSRHQVIWQVKISTQELQNPKVGLAGIKNKASVDDWLANDWPRWVLQFQPDDRGLLKARVKPAPSSESDPCVISPDSRYRGPENQLYRVEVHRGSDGQGGPTFKWSRENGSIIFPIAELASNQAVLKDFGPDADRSLKEGQLVEVLDDTISLQSEAGPLAQVIAVHRDTMTVTLAPMDGAAISDIPAGVANHPLLRRWDHDGDPASGILQLNQAGSAGDGWLDLEDGIQVKFETQNQKYRTGDYWLIPARVATGAIEWPVFRDAQGQPQPDADGNPEPLGLPPHGVDHHYAPLAVITLKADGSIVSQSLRRAFGP